MNRPVIVIGGGGHSKVLINALLLNSVEVIGILDPDTSKHGELIAGVEVLGDDETLREYSPENVYLVNAMGSIGDTDKRKSVFDGFKEKGFTFLSVIHPSAVVGIGVELGEGVQIMAGAIVQPFTKIGGNCIINTQATVDHECVIGDHVHIAPGAILSGGVVIGESTHVGAGAVIIQEIKVGSRCTIGAGATVINNVEQGVVVVGTPARVVRNI